MEFTVTTRPVDDAAGHVETPYRGESRYEILDNGCLTIFDEDGGVLTYAPSVWLTIDEPNGRPRAKVTVF